MRTHLDFVTRSREILHAGQQASGAFLACPQFPVYRYCWFRDSTFIAQSLDLFGEHASARRFYDWGVGIVLDNAGEVQAAGTVPVGEAPARYLHTRYTPDGAHGDEDWPNFQLDGFGTFLWGLNQHLEMTGEQPPADWKAAADLLVDYLVHLWRSPNFDCWEEHPDRIHVATLAALYGGLQASAGRLNNLRAGEAARNIRNFVRAQTVDGYLPKFVGSSTVDASLLWACVPYGLFEADDPIMVRTVAKIEADLLGPGGGIHRYAADEYYGGGAWILLTAAMGECFLAMGKTDRAEEMMNWIEQQASPTGEFAEQVPVDLIHPPMYDQWVNRWGEIAQPLLWSHAAYLRLQHALRTF